MFEKLKGVAERYEQVGERLMDPAVVGDQEQYKNLMREYKGLTPIVEKYREYEKTLAAAAEAEELLKESGLDRELKEMAEEQLLESRKEMEALTEELKILLLPRDPDDDRSVVI